MEKNIYDITIIGAGPVGLFCAFYAGMRQMSINLVDSMEMVGGQLSALYPEKYIFDMPGFPKVMAKDLVKSLWQQAQIGNPTLHLGRKVSKITTSESKIIEVLCENGEIFRTRTVVLSLGMGAFKPRKLEIPGLEEREGKNVHYLVKTLPYYQGKDILIVGGGDSAADWAMALSCKTDGAPPLASSLTMIHRTNKFSAHEASLDILQKETPARVLTHTEIQKIEDVSENGKNRLRVELIQNLTKEVQSILVDDIIVCVGYLAKLDFVKESGFAMEGNAIKVNDKMETNIPGVFAVGDVCGHSAKLKLIATGVGEAAIAANFAKVFIDPTSKAFPGHSTSKMGR